MNCFIITLPVALFLSRDSNLLVILKTTPKTTTVTNGGRSFEAIVPKLWNQLPLAIRQINCCRFKKALETYLFHESSFF